MFDEFLSDSPAQEANGCQNDEHDHVGLILLPGDGVLDVVVVALNLFWQLRQVEDVEVVVQTEGKPVAAHPGEGDDGGGSEEAGNDDGFLQHTSSTEHQSCGGEENIALVSVKSENNVFKSRLVFLAFAVMLQRKLPVFYQQCLEILLILFS